MILRRRRVAAVDAHWLRGLFCHWASFVHERVALIRSSLPHHTGAQVPDDNADHSIDRGVFRRVHATVGATFPASAGFTEPIEKAPIIMSWASGVRPDANPAQSFLAAEAFMLSKVA